MRDWLQRRVLYCQYEKLVAELREEDARGYKNYMRISPDLFQELLVRVGPSLEKGDTFMRKALRPGHRLAIASSTSPSVTTSGEGKVLGLPPFFLIASVFFRGIFLQTRCPSNTL